MKTVWRTIWVMLGLLAVMGLAACSDSATVVTGPTTGAPITPATTSTNTSGPTGTSATGTIDGSGNTSTPIVAATTAPLSVGPEPAGVRDKAVKGLEQLRGNAHSYSVSQSLTLKSGNSTTNIKAEGSGDYSPPDMYQTLNLSISGQTQKVEIFISGSPGFQKLSTLAVWRQLSKPPSFTAAIPATVLEKAVFNGMYFTSGTDNYRFRLPASLLQSEGGLGPDTLGILSAIPDVAKNLSDDPNAIIDVELILRGDKIVGRSTTITTANLSYTVVYTYKTTIPGPPALPPDLKLP